MGSTTVNQSRAQNDQARQDEAKFAEERQKQLKAAFDQESILKQNQAKEKEKEIEKEKEKEKERQKQLQVQQDKEKSSVIIETIKSSDNESFRLSQQATIASEIYKSLNIHIDFSNNMDRTNEYGFTPQPLDDICDQLIQEYGEFQRNESNSEYKTEFRPPMQLEDGSNYEGQWKYNEIDNSVVREGFGKQIFPDGSIFEGYFRNDQRNGKGRRIEVNGNMYNGNWEDNLMDGFGFYSINNTILYEGEFKQNKPKGKGNIVNLKESTSYVGDVYGWHYTQGVLKHGEGVLIRKDSKDPKGDYTYKGSFKNGLRDGKYAEYICENGKKVYKGEFKDDQLTGEGELNSNSGVFVKKYKGKFVNGQKEGYGVLDNGVSVYSGYFHKNLKHGEGELKQGIIITKGIWENDILIQ